MQTRIECAVVSKQLWNYAAGKLPEAEMERVEAHLRACARCRQQALEYKEVVPLALSFRAEPIPASEATWQALRSRIETAQTHATPRHSRRRNALTWGSVALAVCALLWLIGMRARPAKISPPAPQIVQTPQRHDKGRPNPIYPIYPKRAAPFGNQGHPVLPDLQRDSIVKQRPKFSPKRERHLARAQPIQRKSLRREPEQFPVKNALKPNLPAIAALKTPMQPPSIDGDRPTTNALQVRYVLNAASASEAEAGRSYIIKPLPTGGAITASYHERTEEMQPW